MDSITHIALGAVTGEAIAGKYLGKRAMFYGALAQTLPDIDFIGALFLDPTSNLLFHRGFTHSLVFGLLATAAMAFAVDKIHRPLKIPRPTILGLFAVQIALHLILDVCNAYGVGLLEPFSHERYSLHILFVADPFFSAPVGVAMLILLFMSAKNPARRFWIGFGLLLTSGYFLYAISNKLMIVRETTALLRGQNVKYNRLLSTPTPLNSWLWYIAAETDSGYFMGYRAIADKRDTPLALRYVPRRRDLLAPFQSDEDVKKLVRFSRDYYVVTESADTIVFNDLRFGQIAGWSHDNPRYVFHYYVNHKDANMMVVQRGRFSNWNEETFKAMLARIKGKR